MLKRNRVLYTVGIIGTGLHSWKAKECENEKPSEGLSFKRSSRNTQRSSLSVCLCAGTQRMLQPQPEGLVYITRWRQGLAPSIMMLCTKAECEGHRVRDARPMVPAQTCEDNMELGGQTP